MKKLTVAAVVLCTAITFSYCTKERTQQNRVANTVINNMDSKILDFIPEPHTGSKSNLGQADIN